MFSGRRSTKVAESIEERVDSAREPSRKPEEEGEWVFIRVGLVEGTAPLSSWKAKSQSQEPIERHMRDFSWFNGATIKKLNIE